MFLNFAELFVVIHCDRYRCVKFYKVPIDFAAFLLDLLFDALEPVRLSKVSLGPFKLVHQVVQRLFSFYSFRPRYVRAHLVVGAASNLHAYQVATARVV